MLQKNQLFAVDFLRIVFAIIRSDVDGVFVVVFYIISFKLFCSEEMKNLQYIHFKYEHLFSSKSINFHPEKMHKTKSIKLQRKN